jgi:adenine deaminase
VRPARVYQAGRLVAVHGQVLPGRVPDAPAPDWMRGSVHLPVLPDAGAFALEPPAGGLARVIGIHPDTLTTRHLVLDVTDPGSGVARIAVAERHLGTGRVGLGYVLGFGLTRGAIASTVAHDAHNCMIVGDLGPAGPADMAVAIARLAELGGGQVAVLDGRVIAEIALPIAGLMSDRPAAAVAAAVEHLEHVAAAELGVTIGTPFMHLSFLGLSVIPELRITDRGLVDVGKFALTSLAPG